MRLWSARWIRYVLPRRVGSRFRPAFATIRMICQANNRGRSRRRSAPTFQSAYCLECEGGNAMMESAMAAKVLIAVSFPATATSALAQDKIAPVPTKLALKIPRDASGERCIRIENSDPIALRRVALYRTFHDDFDVHPLLSGRWVSLRCADPSRRISQLACPRRTAGSSGAKLWPQCAAARHGQTGLRS